MNHRFPPLVAIDGTAASGKGTLARRLAAHLRYTHLDTGLLYRRVGIDALAAGGDDPQTLASAATRAAKAFERSGDPDSLNDPALRTAEAGRMASVVAAIPEVREALYRFQRRFAENPPPLQDGTAAKGSILDGRDIGTVICPEAAVKFFVTATPEVRARRRFLELQQRGENIPYETLLREMRERDHRDSTRASAPLKPAEGAILIDTTTLPADDVFAAALAFVLKSS